MVALTLAGAAIRFAWLGEQRFWLDEAVTVGLLRMDLADMLDAIPLSESTPPLYYVLAWGWAKVLGTGEAGVRSLSAVAGAATVPVAYAAALRFATRRAAIAAAALVAFAPGLVWYSQEARAYSLLVLFSALSLLCFGRALERPRPGSLAGWALASAAALATHYFAGFLVVAEAAVLAARAGSRRAVALACVPVALAAAALAPLALDQRSQGHLDFIGQVPLLTRIVDTPEVFVSGQTGLKIAWAPAAAVLLLAGGLALFAARATPQERRRGRPLVALLAIGFLVPVGLALVGFDYVLPRNLLALCVPLLILAAAGFATPAAGRAGPAAVGALCLGWAALAVATPAVSDLRRESITAALSGVPGDRATATYSLVAVEAGERRGGSARCPGRDRPRHGRARWLGGERARPPIVTARSPDERGWTATLRRPARRAGVYELSVVCASGPPPRR